MYVGILTVFFSVCFSASAQIDDFQKEVINYLNINGTRQQYGEAFEEVFPLLKRNFSKFDIPNKEWEKLRKDKTEQVDEVIRMLSFAYRKHFTREEIAAMTQFYETEAAQKMIKQKSLSASETKVVQDFFNSEVGEKIETVRPALSKDVEIISSDWSKELFGSKMSTLVKDGYVY